MQGTYDYLKSYQEESGGKPLQSIQYWGHFPEVDCLRNQENGIWTPASLWALHKRHPTPPSFLVTWWSMLTPPPSLIILSLKCMVLILKNSYRKVASFGGMSRVLFSPKLLFFNSSRRKNQYFWLIPNQVLNSTNWTTSDRAQFWC